MIIDAIVKIVTSSLTGVLGLFPAVSLPAGITNLGNKLGAQVAGLDGVFPVVTLGICILALITLQVVMLIIDGIILIYQLFPFKAT